LVEATFRNWEVSTGTIDAQVLCTFSGSYLTITIGVHLTTSWHGHVVALVIHLVASILGADLSVQTLEVIQATLTGVGPDRLLNHLTAVFRQVTDVVCA
jgi:hypothetical protein